MRLPYPGQWARELERSASRGGLGREPGCSEDSIEVGASEEAACPASQAPLRPAFRWDVRCRGVQRPVGESAEGRCICSAERPGRPRRGHPWGRRLCLQNEVQGRDFEIRHQEQGTRLTQEWLCFHSESMMARKSRSLPSARLHLPLNPGNSLAESINTPILQTGRLRLREVPYFVPEVLPSYSVISGLG